MQWLNSYSGHKKALRTDGRTDTSTTSIPIGPKGKNYLETVSVSNRSIATMYTNNNSHWNNHWQNESSYFMTIMIINGNYKWRYMYIEHNSMLFIRCILFVFVLSPERSIVLQAACLCWMAWVLRKSLSWLFYHLKS